MNAEKYNRQIALLCPTCGNRDFQLNCDGECTEGTIVCPSCNRTMSRAELLNENGETVDIALEDVSSAVLEDAEVEIRKMLIDAFKGCSNVRIK